jgi:hypothetical protein
MIVPPAITYWRFRRKIPRFLRILEPNSFRLTDFALYGKMAVPSIKNALAIPSAGQICPKWIWVSGSSNR